jgi:hypothetical protein
MVTPIGLQWDVMNLQLKYILLISALSSLGGISVLHDKTICQNSIRQGAGALVVWA